MTYNFFYAEQISVINLTYFLEGNDSYKKIINNYEYKIHVDMLFESTEENFKEVVRQCT